MWSAVAAKSAGVVPAGFGPGVYGPGAANGTVFMPAEQDGAIQAGLNLGGFWYASEHAKSVAELVAEYEDSVGHNCNYMLELSPDREGRIPAGDLGAYLGLGAALRRCYYSASAPINTTRGALAAAPGRPGVLYMELSLAGKEGADRVRIEEDVARHGQRIRSYEVYASGASSASRGTSATDGASAGGWTQVAAGSSVGHARIHWLAKPLPPNVTLKLVVVRAVGAPVTPLAIRRFAAYSLASCLG